MRGSLGERIRSHLHRWSRAVRGAGRLSGTAVPGDGNGGGVVGRAPDDRLDGWKEIAAHLTKSVKTAQRWEERYGLPVHRVAEGQGATGASVFAYKDELEEWLGENGAGGAAETGASPPRTFSRPVGWTVLGVVAVAVGLLLTAVSPFHRPNPFSVLRAGDRNLVVLDSEGEPLWSIGFETPFNERHIGARPWRILDLDGDGVDEIVFFHASPGPQPGPEDGLYLFGPDGELRWERHPGRELVIDGRHYANEFKVRDLDVGTLADGTKFIAVAAVHRPWSPTQVTMLDPRGEVVGEYWNHGYVLDLMLLDVDEDGDEEVLLGGINDAIDKPFVAVIDHDIELSMAPGPHQVPADMKRGLETAYIAFPHTAAARGLGVGSEVVLLRPQGGGFLVETRFDAGSIRDRVYSFSRNLELLHLAFKRSFRLRHQELLAEGRVDVDLEQERERLMNVEWLVGAPLSSH